MKTAGVLASALPCALLALCLSSVATAQEANTRAALRSDAIVQLYDSARVAAQQQLQGQSLAEILQFAESTLTAEALDDRWRMAALLERDRSALLTATFDVLREAPRHPKSHAFAVALLVELSPPGIDTSLLELYPTLDADGRYQVLLRGLDTLDPRYAALFSAALTAEQNSPLPGREGALAVAYASLSRDPQLHLALASWWSSHQDINYDELRLPIRGLLGPGNRLDIRNLPSLIEHALQVGASAAANADHVMSPQELNLLATTRSRLLDPPALGNIGSVSTLGELLDALQAGTPALEFAVARGLRSLDLPTGLPDGQQTLTDVLAWLCNTMNLSILNILDSDPERWRWSIAEQRDDDFRLNMRCVSTRGFLLEVNVLHFSFLSDRPTLTLSWLNSGWLDLQQSSPAFELELLQGVTPASYLGRHAGSQGTIVELQLPVPGTPITVTGLARLGIPASVRIRDVSLGDEPLHLQDGPLSLTYTPNGVATTLGYGANPPFYPWPQSPPPFNKGHLQRFDATDTAMEGLGWRSHAEGLPYYTTLGSPPPPRQQPWEVARVIWTYAPTVEYIELPLVFEDLPLERITTH